MTVYATQFDATTGECEPSHETDFETVQAVVEVLGPPDSDHRPAMVIYGDGKDRIVYTRFKYSY